MAKRFLGGVVAVLASILIEANGTATAQSRGLSAPTALPPLSLTAPDDAFAVDLNPAAMAFLPAWSVAYVHADARSSHPLDGRGDGVAVAVPLPFGIALGASAHSVRPTTAAGSLSRGIGSLAVAWAPSSRFSLGSALRFITSADDRLDGTTTVDLALSYRPSVWFATSLMAYDFTRPRLGQDAGYLSRSFVWSGAFRPWGRDGLTFDAAASLDDRGTFGARGAVAASVPYIGRIQAAAEGRSLNKGEADYRVTAGVAVDWGYVGAGGGVLLGKGDNGPGYYVSGRIDGFTREGLPRASIISDVQVKSSGARSLIQLVFELDHALRDDRVRGVLLRLRSSDIDLAGAQEIRQLIASLHRAKKPVVCHLDDATGSEFYACSAAHRVFIDPAGGVRLMGPNVTVLLFGDLLKTLGVRADFLRIGIYKSAPEQFLNRRLTPPARAERDVLIDDMYHRLVVDLARDFKVTEADAMKIIDNGPYAAPEALHAKLVYGAADEFDLDEHLRALHGEDYIRREEAPTAHKKNWSVAPRIGVVLVDGTIVDGENVDVPFVGVHLSGGATVARAVDGLAADPTVRAIVVRVDSPGGSALASDQIWRALMRARQVKPVIASFGSVAASGGYYVAAAAHEIWSMPSTLTGSIGIYFGKVDFAPLAERLGVGIEIFKRGRHAGAESIWRPFTDEERNLLSGKLKIWYGMFLKRIAEGRHMKIDAIDAVGQGRVWSGDTAKRIGLVDHLGGFASALARARQLAGLPRDAEVVIAPEAPKGLLDYVLGTGSKTDTGAASSLLLQQRSMRNAVSMLAGMYMHAAGAPLAIMPAAFSAE